MIFNLSYKSILNRKTSFLLSVFSIAISVVLLLGIDRMVKDTKQHFLNTISQTDMIVASSNGSIEILLNLIFHIGDGFEKIDYKVFKEIEKQDEIKWAVPLSLGGNVKGFDLLSTTNSYFKNYKYSQEKSLELQKGEYFKNFYDIVVGANAAKKLKLNLGSIVHITHSHKHAKEHHEHHNREFVVTGILKPSSTPNDDLIFMQLKANEAIHIEWQSGHFVNMHISSEALAKMDIQPKHISGFLLGLKNPITILGMQDRLDHYKGANLKAVIPAKALSKLYKLIEKFQDMLMFISSMVFATAMFTMLSSMYSTLNQRAREIAILRSLGASAKIVFTLFALESAIILACGIFLGNLILTMLILIFNQSLEISLVPSAKELIMLALMFIVAIVVSLIPAIKTYKHNLQDGLNIKL